MDRAGGNSASTDASLDDPHQRAVVVDVILLLTREGQILLRERTNTGYGDGAYEPPSGELADRETIVETAARVAAEAGIAVGAENVSLAHVMHDVSGGGRIAFFLSVSGWVGQPASTGTRWFPLGNLPTNMLDRARVALRNYAGGLRFSTYPAFGPAVRSPAADPWRPVRVAGAEAHDACIQPGNGRPHWAARPHRAGRSSTAGGARGAGECRAASAGGSPGANATSKPSGAGGSYVASGVVEGSTARARGGAPAQREETFGARLRG